MRSFFSEPPTRSQRLGMLLACFIILIALSTRFYLKRQGVAKQSAALLYSPQWDSLLLENEQRMAANDSLLLHPMFFDPNTVQENELKRMGLRQKVIQTWLHYREKGGRFYKPEHVQRLYALRDTEFAQLAPFIRIENRSLPATIPQRIELNTADTTALMQLPGIGAKRALAIVQYREQLGGYSNVQQLLEIWAIDTPTFQKIKPHLRVNPNAIKPLPFLEITWKEFQKHPYFSGPLGQQLLTWRKNKSYRIESIDELMEIKTIDSVLFRKIAPYLSLKQTVQN